MNESDFEKSEDTAYEELGDRLRSDPGLVRTLPDQEQRVARAVANGLKPFEIAGDEGISEDAVWALIRSLGNAVGATSQPVRSRGYETAGLGADTDPGVTGGYGDTGFGSIGNEPPVPATEEPEEGSEEI